MSPLERASRAWLDVEIEVNGRRHALRIEARETLTDVLRNRLALRGSKVSCDAQVCGTCTLLVDGIAVSGCTYLAADADGRAVRSVEGLADAATGVLSPLQLAFIRHAAFQCGYCTPGFLMAATALLEAEPRPSREAVIVALEGNICRCTGYEQIVDAVLDAASFSEAPRREPAPVGRREDAP